MVTVEDIMKLFSICRIRLTKGNRTKSKKCKYSFITKEESLIKQKKEYDKAITDFNKAIEFDSENAAGYINNRISL